MTAVAGGPENTIYLQKGCQLVAKAARIGDPAARLDWGQVAIWLDAGIPIGVICKAIERQVRQMGDRYEGCRTLRLFHSSVLNLWEIERRRE